MDINNPRKKVGGKLEVRVRVRTPLAKPEIVVKTERWLRLEFGSGVALIEASVPSNPQSLNALDSVDKLVDGSTPSESKTVTSSKFDSSQPPSISGTSQLPLGSGSSQDLIQKSSSKIAPSEAASEDLLDLELQFFKYIFIYALFCFPKNLIYINICF